MFQKNGEFCINFVECWMVIRDSKYRPNSLVMDVTIINLQNFVWLIKQPPWWDFKQFNCKQLKDRFVRDTTDIQIYNFSLFYGTRSHSNTIKNIQISPVYCHTLHLLRRNIIIKKVKLLLTLYRPLPPLSFLLSKAEASCSSPPSPPKGYFISSQE